MMLMDRLAATEDPAFVWAQFFFWFFFAACGCMVNNWFGWPRMNWAAWLAGYFFVVLLAVGYLVATRSAEGLAFSPLLQAAMALLYFTIVALYARGWRKRHPKRPP